MGNCLCCGDKGRAHESDTEGTNANELATHNRIEVSHKRRESVAWNQEDDFATTGDSPNSVFNDVSLSCSPRNNGLIATAPPDEGSFASPTEDLLPPSASEEDPHADSTPNHALHVAPLDEDAPCATPVIEERLRDISQEADEYAVPTTENLPSAPTPREDAVQNASTHENVSQPDSVHEKAPHTPSCNGDAPAPVHAEDTRHATASQDENPFTSLRHNDDNDFVDTRDDDPVNSFRGRPRYTVDSHGENPFTSSRYNTVSIDDEYFHETIRKTSTPVVSARNVRPNSFKTADLHDEELSAAPVQIGYRTERAYTNNTKWSTAEPSRENDDVATKAFESREVPHNDAAVLETPPVLRSGPDLVGATPEDLSAERGAVCDAREPADIPDKAPVKRGGLLPPVLGSTPREGGELIEDYEKIGENGISERQEEKSHEFVGDNEAPKQEEEAELRKEKSDASLEDLKTGDDKGFIGDSQVGGVKELSYNTELDKEDEGRLSDVARSERVREADDCERSAQAEENVSNVQPQGKHVDPCSISDNVDYPTVLPENMQERMIKQDSSDTNVDKDSEGGAKALHTEPGSEDVVEKAPENLAHGETDGARIAEVVEESPEQRLQDAVIPNAVCEDNEEHQQKEIHGPTEPKGKTYDIDALFASVAPQPLAGKQYAIPNAVCEDNEKHQQKEIHGPTEPKGKTYDIDALFASVAQQPLHKEQQVDGEGVPASQPYPLEGSAAEPKVAELDVANEGEDNQIGGTDGVDLLYSDAVDPGESQENLEAGMLGKEGRVLSWSSVGSKDNSAEQEIPGDASTANDENSTVRQAHATSGTSGEKADQWWQWDNVTHPEDPKPKTQWEGMTENNEKNSKISNGSEAEAKIYTSVEKHDGSTEEDVSSREVAESTLAASSEDAMTKNRLNANRPRPSVIISPLPVPTPREGGEGEEDIL